MNETRAKRPFILFGLVQPIFYLAMTFVAAGQTNTNTKADEDLVRDLLVSPHGLNRLAPHKKDILGEMEQDPEKYLPSIAKIVSERLASGDYLSVECGIELMGRLGSSGPSNIVNVLVALQARMDEQQKEAKGEALKLRDLEALAFSLLRLKGVYDERAINVALDAFTKRDLMNLGGARSYLIGTNNDKILQRIELRLRERDGTDQGRRNLIDLRDDLKRKGSS